MTILFKQKHIFLFLTVLFVFLSAPVTSLKVNLFSIPLYGPEIITLFLAVITLKHLKNHPHIFWPKAFRYGQLLLFVGVATSLLINFTPHGLGVVKSWFVFPIFFAWMLTQFLSDARDRRAVLWGWYSALIFITLLSLGSWLLGDTTYDGRLHGIFASPNSLALFLFPAPFLAWHLSSITAYSWLKKCILCTGTLSLIVIFLTFSYTVWVSLLGGGIILASLAWPHIHFSQIKKIFAVFLLLGLVMAVTQIHNPKLTNWFFTPERSSLASRIMIWQSAFRILHDHPLVGIGPGNFQTTYLNYQQFFPLYLEWSVPEPHNLFLAFWLESGLIGLLGFLWLLVALGKTLIETMQKNPASRPEIALLASLLVSILIQGCFDTPYWKTELSYMFWILMSLSLSISLEPQKRPPYNLIR